MCANLQPDPSVPNEGYVPVENAALFYRAVGHGQPIILLHGGPDFDHRYLLPDMDRLSDSYRLIYYDQRGRGKSADGVAPEQVSIQSEIEDLERLRQYFQLDSVAILGHSWGSVLAMEYAIRHPESVSHLILMNTGAASHEDALAMRQEVRRRRAVCGEELQAVRSSPAYREGDPDAVIDYYRFHFSVTIKQPEHLERLLASMRPSFTKDGILLGRAIEDRLYAETWWSKDFDRFPALKQLAIPALVIHGDYDFIPVECAAHIVQAIPGARFVLLKDCGHFPYIESPDEVRRALADFFASNSQDPISWMALPT